jgi:histidine ammonia-lyase
MPISHTHLSFGSSQLNGKARLFATHHQELVHQLKTKLRTVYGLNIGFGWNEYENFLHSSKVKLSIVANSPKNVVYAHLVDGPFEIGLLLK